nr:putative ribonuclease h protein [Quercus suber]
MSHAMEFFFLSSIPAWHPCPSSPTSTRWCPTPPPYVTINIDGSSKGNPGIFGAGGMARSATGEWLWGFSLNLPTIPW